MKFRSDVSTAGEFGLGTQQDWELREKVVLIVDDDPHVLRLASGLLSSAGYQTLEAGSPGEALAIATQVKIDILLVDAVLPGRSGPDLAEELLKLQPLGKMVFMSGLDPMAVWMAYGKPCQVLQKPFSRAELLGKMELPSAMASDCFRPKRISVVQADKPATSASAKAPVLRFPKV